MKTHWICSILISSTIILSGCQTEGGVEGEGISLLKTTNPPPYSLEDKDADREIAKNIKEKVEENKKIYDCIVIKGKKDVLVAYKVRHMYRFQMKKIEKDLLEELKDHFGNEKLTVSSDYKIFLEAYRLQKRARNEEITKEEAEKRLQEIIKLSQEKT